MIKKNSREIDKKYIQFIKNQRCLICEKIPCDPHHTKTVATFGSDYTAICLCREHHSECHQIGQATFQEKYLISFDKAIERLLGEYIENKFSISVIDILISYIKAKKLAYLDPLPF